MHVLYMNRKYIYIALLLLILIYILIFYILSLKITLTENNIYEKNNIYTVQ